MTLKALIVDDEYPARKELRYLLENFFDVEVVGEATNAQEALKLISAINYTVVFVDIQMPGMTGLELGELLRQHSGFPYVIFVTAFEEYAVKAFEVDAVDYLLKPFDQRRLSQALEKVRKLVEQNQARQRDSKNHPGEQGDPSRQEYLDQLDRLPAEKQGKTLLISPEEIIYAYVQEDAVYIRTDQDTLLSRFSLKDLEARLDPKHFFRTHRRFIVNLTKVREIIPFFNGTYSLVLLDEGSSEVPVSRNHARRLRELLGI